MCVNPMPLPWLLLLDEGIGPWFVAFSWQISFSQGRSPLPFLYRHTPLRLTSWFLAQLPVPILYLALPFLAIRVSVSNFSST